MDYTHSVQDTEELQDILSSSCTQEVGVAHLSTVSTSFCIMIAKEGERQYVWGSSSSPSEFSNAASAREESALSERERGGRYERGRGKGEGRGGKEGGEEETKISSLH